MIDGCFVDTQRPGPKLGRRPGGSTWASTTSIGSRRGRCSARARDRDDPAANLFWFISDTGINDPALLAKLEEVLRDLAAEKAGR
jgi:hypothetical protein